MLWYAMQTHFPPQAPMPSARKDSIQFPLIHVVESDDVHLEQQSDLVWFDVIRNFEWKLWLPVAVAYYEALWQFNEAQAAGREQRAAAASVANPETRQDATMRLALERPTSGTPAPALAQVPTPALEPWHVNPADISPGQVPVRIAGRTPKCFFAMFQAFLGLALRGRQPEPEEVYDELRSNPGFARVCGFTLPKARRGYRHTDVPSLRKLEQFDQIMTDNGLWQKAKVLQVTENLKTGRLPVEPTLVHDTTHYKAYSGRQTVEIKQAQAPSAAVKPADKPRRKSQPRTTKNCRCQDQRLCGHPWISADEGAGTVVKSGGKMHWGHKASTLAFAGREMPLDAAAMSDAAAHDSNSLQPHLEHIFTTYPELKGKITRVLDDRAADDQDLKKALAGDYGIELLAAPNPRGRKPINNDLPRGIDHISNTGTPVCRAGLPFDFLGCRHETKQFLFRAPLNDQGQPVCSGCQFQTSCCQPGGSRRQVAVPFERLPWMDPNFPHLSQRFQKIMARRTVIERVHKLMKFDYGDDRLSKRGNRAFQARLDKTLLAMHLVLAAS
jgi:hypothetical protein